MVNSFEFNGHEIALLCTVAENASTHLVSLDGFEERFKITLAEALIFFSLDKLEENRTNGFLGEDLQQEARISALCTPVE